MTKLIIDRPTIPSRQLSRYGDGHILRLVTEEAEERGLRPVVRQLSIPGTDYDWSFGWLHGALLANGWTSRGCIGFSSTDDDKRSQFLEIARSYIGASFSVREYRDDGNRPDKYGPSVKLHLNGEFVTQNIFSIYGDRSPDTQADERQALRKRIPTELLEDGSRDCLLGILAGILECGTMTWNRHFEKPRAVIRFGTSSHDFVTSFDRLAHRLGLRISITTTAPRNQSRVTYTVSPSVPDLWRLGRDLHFATNEAREYWQEFLDQERPRDLHDIIPIMREDALHIMWSSFAGERNYSIAATARRIGSVTRLSAEHLAEGQPRDIYPQLFAALDADNILWERINGFNRTKSSALITTEKSR